MNPSGHEILALLVLNRLLAATGRVCARLQSGEQPSAILEEIREKGLFGKAEALEKLFTAFSPEREIDLCLKQGTRLVSFTDAAYPSLLKELADPPLVLYVRGHLADSDRAAVAMVGSRQPTAYGLVQTMRFAAALAGSGWTVVSGMASGIDQAAHEGALQVPYGRTLAVLGSGVDIAYPKENRKLYERIQERGAVISEYPLGTQPLPHHFPRRNRIIAGLSLGVLVAEAHIKSGSLITAREALDQGKEVFAIPGNIDRLTSCGPHQLIRDGAWLADSPETVSEILSGAYRRFFPGTYEGLPDAAQKAPEPCVVIQSKKEAPHLTSEERSILEMLSEQPRCYDELAGAWPFAGPSLFSSLLNMEMEGKIVKTPDGFFAVRTGDSF